MSLACLLAFFTPSISAQTNGAPAVEPLNRDQPVSSEQIATARQAAESDTSLDETRKKKALELFDQAAQWLKQVEDTRAQLGKLQAKVRDAPDRIVAIREGESPLEQTLGDVQSLIDAGNKERIELALTQEQLALQQARDAQKKQADELDRLLVGSQGVSEEIASRTQALEQIQADLEAPAADEPDAVAKARGLVLRIRRTLRQTELELLKLRLGSHDLLTNLAQAERDLAAAEITRRQERLDKLTGAAQALREAQARQAREEAEALKLKTGALPQALQTIAGENARYRQELELLVGREQAVARELLDRRQYLEEIKADFARTRERVDVVGATEAVGKMLKHRRDELPSPQGYQRTSASRAVEIERVTDRQIEIDESLRAQGDVPSAMDAALNLLPEQDRGRFREQTEELVRARRATLNELQKVYGRYIGQITSLDLAERQLVEVADAYIEYIDDQLIWIPGPGLGSLLSPWQWGQALVWLFSPTHWGNFSEDTWMLAQERPIRVILLLGLVALLLKRRSASRERLKLIAKETRKIRTDSFRLTLEALFHTLVIIGPWPLLLSGSGALLNRLDSASAFTASIANGLLETGIILLGLLLLIELCRTDGVGDRHLHWPKGVRDALVRELSWIMRAGVPLGFLVTIAKGIEPTMQAHQIGRGAFILLMALSSLFVYRLLRRGGDLMRTVNQSSSSGLLWQLHFLWFPLLAALPLVFAGTSIAGYHYTSLHLELQAELTFWFFVSLFLFKELLLRSLYIAERRLRLEDALRRRDELRAQRAQDEEEKEEEPPLVSLDIPELDFNELSEQNRRLVRAGFLFGAVIGLWSIWNDLLPALGFLNATELPFHASRIVDGVAKDVPVTLGDLIVGLILILITILAAKNIPGVLEIALLQRLPLDPGARYAITSLTQYVISGIGVVVAFSTLGLQWSSIQWLVAALSVGLGFGLQEIVANFISGIILLFERPIRVGDVVTIGNTTGVVSRIRIRATTITNYDKQELLIPNKEFITGQVINWTLSDRVNRIIITVGVAYGSDVAKAMSLMLEAAQQNDHVLEEPKPVVTFESFGDNALSLLLRCYLGSMDNRLSTVTGLHQAINDKFNAAGINIAFPQRDIHLSTSAPLDVRLRE